MTSQMIAFSVAQSSFWLRAAALIWRNNHILVQRDVRTSNWALPGGRVELHETGAEALTRELREELSSNAAVGDLRLVIENHYSKGLEQVHSIGFYYDVTLDRSFRFDETEIVHRCRDGQAELEFRWVPVRQDTLADLDLRPAVLLEFLECPSAGIMHRVSRSI